MTRQGDPMSDSEKLGTRQNIWDSSTVDGYHAFFEDAADGMFITDQHWRFLAANRQWLTLSGYSLNDLLALDCTTIIDHQDLLLQPPITAILQQDSMVTREQCCLRKDGSRLHVDISQRALADGNILSVVRDITERKQAETDAGKRTGELAALQALSLAVSSSLSLDLVCKAAGIHSFASLPLRAGAEIIGSLVLPR